MGWPQDKATVSILYTAVSILFTELEGCSLGPDHSQLYAKTSQRPVNAINLRRLHFINMSVLMYAMGSVSTAKLADFMVYRLQYRC